MAPQYKQRFRKVWLSEVLLKDWILEIPGSPDKVKCKFCKCILAAKHCDLLSHCTTKKHHSASAKFSSSQELDTFVSTNKDSEEVNAAEASLSLFIACHTSVRTIDDLGELCKHRFSDSLIANKFQLNQSKCTAIIKFALAPHFEKTLLNDIGTGHFSILINEGLISSDISVTKMLGIAVVYLSNQSGKVESTFLALTELDTCDAESIAATIREILNSKGLNIQNMKGIGVDNASVMTGINNDIFTKLQTECPGLKMIRCVCHSLQLAVSTASDCLPTNLDFLVREIYNWFSHSVLRQNAYKVLFAAMNDGHNPRSIVQKCQTHWLSVETAVSRILDHWVELGDMFKIASTNEKDYTTSLLSSMISDEKNHAFLLFLRPVLAEVQRVNKSFEASNADCTKLLDDLAGLVESIAKKFVLPTCKKDFLTENLDDSVHWRAYLNYEVEELLHEMKLPAEEESEFRKQCIVFLIRLHKELQARLPDDIKVLRSMSAISVSHALRVIKEPLIPLMNNLQIPSEKITKAELQWMNLTTVKWEKTASTVQFWSEVAGYKDAFDINPFQELVELVKSLIVFPWSNAEVERIFSLMNIMESKRQNQMEAELVNAILTIKEGLSRINKCCKDYQFPSEVLMKIGTLANYKDEETENQTTSTSHSKHFFLDDIPEDGDDICYFELSENVLNKREETGPDIIIVKYNAVKKENQIEQCQEQKMI